MRSRSGKAGKRRRTVTAVFGMILVLLLAAACSSNGGGGGSVSAKLTSCIFSASTDAVIVQVVLVNNAGNDADITAEVYWLTSQQPAGAFGNGNDGGLSSAVIGADYVGGDEPAETDVSSDSSTIVPVDMPLGGTPRPPGLRCALGSVTNNGPPFAG